MIKKIKSIIDGNSLEVIHLKFKKKIQRSNAPNLIVPNYKDIPIIINNRNRLFFLKKLISYLINKNYKNLILLDNQSTYLPLIDFYNKTNHKVIRFQDNKGYLSLWKSSFFDKIKNNYYVYTDPDVLPIDECPKDFLNYFLDCLNKNPKLDKVGFGIEINDIPHKETLNKFIIKNEKKFWLKKIPNSNLYKAPIDTTFALYRPNAFGGYWLSSARSEYPYLIRHLPWYDEKDEKEEIFYSENILKNSSFYVSKRYEEY